MEQEQSSNRAFVLTISFIVTVFLIATAFTYFDVWPVFDSLVSGTDICSTQGQDGVLQIDECNPH